MRFSPIHDTRSARPSILPHEDLVGELFVLLLLPTWVMRQHSPRVSERLYTIQCIWGALPMKKTYLTSLDDGVE